LTVASPPRLVAAAELSHVALVDALELVLLLRSKEPVAA
jgi:hypothetical protein